MSQTITDVDPFTRVKDVDVEMTIAKPQAVIGLGNMLILHQIAPSGKAATGGNVISRTTDSITGAQYTEYADADAMSAAVTGKTDPVYVKARNYFMQSAASDRVAVLEYPTGKLSDALKAFWYYNWTFMVFDTPQLTGSSPSDDAIIASNICEANKDHFLVLQADQPAVYKPLNAQNYTIGLVHDLNEPMDAALIGSIANLKVGSVTWKFRKLKGITPDHITVQAKNAVDLMHAIAYIEVAGQGQTSEGWVLSGDYIDSLHGDLWVKTNIGNKLQKYLQNTDKVPYDQRGINALSAIVSQVLQQAYEQDIILEQEVYDSNTGKSQATGKGDFSVSATSRSAQSAQDLSSRHYGGLSFIYHRSGAIHTVTVHGTVQSDTFTTSKA